VVGDEVVSVCGDEHLPLGVRWGCETSGGVVQVADETRGASKLRAGFEEVEPVGPGHVSRREGEHLTAPIVDAQRARRAVETHRVEMIEQRVDSRGPRSARAAHGIPDADDFGADIPAGQRLFLVTHA
jgi:hypothetical protein